VGEGVGGGVEGGSGGVGGSGLVECRGCGGWTVWVFSRVCGGSGVCGVMEFTVRLDGVYGAHGVVGCSKTPRMVSTVQVLKVPKGAGVLGVFGRCGRS